MKDCSNFLANFFSIFSLKGSFKELHRKRNEVGDPVKGIASDGKPAGGKQKKEIDVCHFYSSMSASGLI